MQDEFIKMPKTFSSISEIDIEDILNLAIIKATKNNYSKLAHLSINQILESRTQSASNKTARERVKKSLSNLLDKGYIIVFQDIAKEKIVNDLTDTKSNHTLYMCDTEKNEDTFTKLYVEDILPIINANKNHKAISMSIYLRISDCLYHSETSDVYCYPAINTIAEDLSIDRKSVIKYIKELHDKEIICCITMKVGSKKYKNFYCRWKDREEMAKAIQDNKLSYIDEGKSVKIELGNPSTK